jgi:hypothetical protein
MSWNNFGGKFSGQQKSILHPKENHKNNGRYFVKGSFCSELFKKFNIPSLAAKSCSHCHS